MFSSPSFPKPSSRPDPLTLPGIHSFLVGLDHRGCKITPSVQLFTIFLGAAAARVESGFATVQTVPITGRCIPVVLTGPCACFSRAEPEQSHLLPSAHSGAGRRPILSLINVSNNRGATWLQQRNSVGNWSEHWSRDFGYRACVRCWRRETNFPPIFTSPLFSDSLFDCVRIRGMFFRRERIRSHSES